MRTILLFAVQMMFVAAVQAGVYYKVKFPDDLALTGCGVAVPKDYPEIIKKGYCYVDPGVSYSDQIFYLNATKTCYKILRTWKLLWWCDYNPNRYPVVINNPADTDTGAWAEGNYYNHGYLQYTQIIKVQDNVGPVFTNCPKSDVVFCDYTDNNPKLYNKYGIDRCEGPIKLRTVLTDACSKTDLTLSYRLLFDLDENGSMETVINSSTPGAYPIERTVKNDTLYAQIKFPDTFALVHGRHKVEWTAGDKCGGWSVCKYEFVVKDCKAPTLACRPGLGVNLMNSQPAMVTIWDKDFIIKASDNCTTPDDLRIGIRKTGIGTGFPGDKSVTFDCMELGAQSVDVWVMDDAGNADFCRTQIRIQDNAGSCPAGLPFSGKVYTPEGNPAPGVEIALSNTNVSSLQFKTKTDSAGIFAIDALPAQCAYALKPHLNTGLLDGVDALDALLLDAHVQGTEALDSPYRLLAADLNRSGKIAADDVQALVDALTGAKTAFPSNNSWRFVPAGYDFPDAANPFKAAVPDASVFCMSGNAPHATDFIAVKVGDVNEDGGSAAVQFSENKADIMHFTAPEQLFKTGDTLRVALATPALDGLSAFQLAVLFDSAALALQTIEPGLLNAKQFYFNKNRHCVTAAWHSVKQLSDKPAYSGRHNAFVLVFTALQDGKTSEVVRAMDQALPAGAFDAYLQKHPATLAFEPETAGERGGPLAAPETGLRVQPNPVRSALTATFYMPADGPLQFDLIDCSGKTAISAQGSFTKGYGEQRLELPTAVNSGVYFLRMSGVQGVWTARVLVVR